MSSFTVSSQSFFCLEFVLNLFFQNFSSFLANNKIILSILISIFFFTFFPSLFYSCQETRSFCRGVRGRFLVFIVDPALFFCPCIHSEVFFISSSSLCAHARTHSPRFCSFRSAPYLLILSHIDFLLEPARRRLIESQFPSLCFIVIFGSA